MRNWIINKEHAMVAFSYLALLVLQPVWHSILPPPLGAGAWWLGAIAALPLLLPLRGLLTGSIRSMTWAGYLLLLYLLVGITEAWSNPPQRTPALIQTALVAVSIWGMLMFSRTR